MKTRISAIFSPKKKGSSGYSFGPYFEGTPLNCTPLKHVFPAPFLFPPPPKNGKCWLVFEGTPLQRLFLSPVFFPIDVQNGKGWADHSKGKPHDPHSLCMRSRTRLKAPPIPDHVPRQSRSGRHLILFYQLSIRRCELEFWNCMVAAVVCRGFCAQKGLNIGSSLSCDYTNGIAGAKVWNVERTEQAASCNANTNI